jgi:predicted MFS family arabinose efflux permease
MEGFAGGGELPRPPMGWLACTVFAAGAAVHYQAPMLGEIGVEFGADAAAVGWVPTLTFGGFVAGMIFIVPLGDRLEKRALILSQIAVLIVMSLCMAASPSLIAAATASFGIGASVCYTQSIIPMVVELTSPRERGRTVGTLLTALFLGILFGRLAGGIIASHLGWRWAYVFSAALLLALASALALRLPSTPPKTQLGYLSLIASLTRLLRTHSGLRHASAIQYCLGICYGGFWATLAPMLLLLHHLGPTEAGLMGIPGAAGILIARPAGRWLDRHGAFPVVLLGVCLVLAAFIALGLAFWWVAPVIVGAMLLDCGLRAAMVANQTLVTAEDPQARSRFNTVYGAHIWAGNTSGAFLASTALAYGGWGAVPEAAIPRAHTAPHPP